MFHLSKGKLWLCELMAHQGEGGRPKRMWIEVIKIDLKKCYMFKDLAHDKSISREKSDFI